MRQLLWLSARAVEPVDVADARRGGSDQSELRPIGRGAKTHHSLIAAADICFLAGSHIEGAEICFALFAEQRHDAFAVGRPNRRKAAATARSRIVAANAGTEIEIKIARQVSRLSVWCNIHYPKIGFGVRLHRLIYRSIKSNLFAVRAHRKRAGAHVDRSEFCR